MKKLFIIFFISICSVAFANEFIVKRKNKLPSVAKLKEKVCDCLAQQHNCISDVIGHVVNIQKTQFNILSAEVDGESMLNIPKEKLQHVIEKSNEFQEKLERFQQDANEYYNVLKAL